ncbi:MAG: exodeoxyribonuclease VII large subunit [Acidimicrobiales bacterium]
MATVPDGEPRIWAIGDLNRRASLAVVRDFRGQVWAAGELTRLDDRRGNRWLELVERGGGRDGRDAHLEAFCSATKWQRLERKLADAGVELRAGQRLVVVGCLDIADRGKLTLTVDDVDVAALVGERLRDRQRLVQRLVDDDLFDANRRLDVSPLPLRVGLVASGGSDGHRDVVRQLEGSGFAFHVILRSIPVEGPTAPRAIRAALATFGPADVDVALVARGGGAKASLDVFDAPMVAHAIATAAVPVWTGIGHTGDRTVADEVANRSFATPTAVGQALVTSVAAAWDVVAGSVARVVHLVDARLGLSTTQLHGQRRTVSTLARHQLALHEQTRARASSDLRRAAAGCLDVRAGHLVTAAHRIRASGGAGLRDAHRRLTDVALDTVGAARRQCVESTADLAAAAVAASAGAATALQGAGQPIERAGSLLGRHRFDSLLDDQSAVVAEVGRRIGRDVRRGLVLYGDRAAAQRAVLEAYDPHRQLARGWTLTHTPDGRLLRRAAEVAEGDALVTTFADGAASSTVVGVTRTEQEAQRHE